MALIGSRYSGIRSRTPQSRNRTAKRERLTLGAVVIVRWVSNLAGLVQAARKMLDRRLVSTSKNDVERGESNGTIAGLALRRPTAAPKSRLRAGWHPIAGPGNRREYGDLSIARCRSAAQLASPKAARTGRSADCGRQPRNGHQSRRVWAIDATGMARDPGAP